MVVVWVTRFPVGKNDGVRARLADFSGEGEFVLARWLDVRIGNTETAAIADSQNFGGAGSFFGARFRSATSAHFAGGEVKDAGFVALLRGLEEGAAAGEFDVVGMGGDSENVEGHWASLGCGEIVR